MKKLLAIAAVCASLSVAAPVQAFIYETCATDDVTFGVSGSSASDSDACFGWDSQYGSVSVELGMVETNFGTESNNDWVYVTKFEGSTAYGSYGDVDFTLTASNYSDSWALSWNDPEGNTLPSSFDFAVVLKAGQGTGGYLFDDVTLPVYPNTGLGEFEVGILNRRGRELSLSHMTLFLRDGSGSGPGPDPEVPVPGTLALLVPALIGLRWKMTRTPANQDDDVEVDNPVE